MKKLISIVVSLFLVASICVPAFAADAPQQQSSYTADSVRPRYIPVTVEDRIIMVTNYDGTSFIGDTSYKEITLPSSNHYYVQSAPKLESAIYDSYWDNIKRKSIVTFYYTYEIKMY